MVTIFENVLKVRASYFLGFGKPQLPVCEEGLGLESYAIPDSSVTASSVDSPFLCSLQWKA